MTTALIALCDRFPGGLLVTDTDSRVVYANRSVERRTGYAIAEIVGKKPGELWGGHMPQGFYAELWQTIGIEARPFVGRFDNQPKAEVRRWETLQIAPLKDSGGTTRYYVEIHPELDSLAEERSFHRQFLAEAGEWHRAPEMWRRFLEWLSPETERMTLAETLAGETDLAEFVRAELVLPTQMALARRFEDTTLIQAAQADPAAFAFLYEKYLALIRQYFCRRVASPQEAEDLAQEAFVRAFRALPHFRIANASYYTYLLHVAHNLLVDHYRSTARSPVWQSETLEAVAETGAAPDLENLEMLLVSLSPIERSVMLLTYRDGFRAREVGEQLGKTENAVKLILSRSRKKLRMALT